MSDEIFGKKAKDIIKEINAGILPVSKNLRQSLRTSINLVIDGHIKEKELFLAELKKIEKEALANINDSGEATKEVAKFSDSFNNNSPISIADVNRFKDYYQTVIRKGESFDTSVKDSTNSAVNWEAITAVANKIDRRGTAAVLGKLQAVAQKVDRLTMEELGDIDNADDSFNRLVELAAGDMNLGVTIEKRKFSSSRASIKVEIELESLASGKDALSTTLTGKVRRLVDSYDSKVHKAMEKQLSKIELADVRFSPSFTNDVEKELAAAFLGKKVKRSKKVATKKQTSKLRASKSKLQKKKNKHKKAKKGINSTLGNITAAYKRSQAPVNFSTLRVMSIINEMLAARVRDEMGDAADEPIRLRSQTGRFSESANMLTLTRGKANTLLGTYSYMRYPYDVFLPGGRLDNGSRDPRIYIEGAARKAARDILGVNFQGIQLELV